MTRTRIRKNQHHHQLPIRARLINRLKRKKTPLDDDGDGPKLYRGKSELLGNIRQSYAKRGSLDVSSLRRRRSLETVSTHNDTTTSSDNKASEQHHHSDGENESHNKRVHFSEDSTVKEIPHFSAYTESQRFAMWNGRQAIRRMVRKNTAEYDYEGWSVDSTIEEDDFVMVSGVRVHPAHVSRERKKQLEAAKILRDLNFYI